MSLLSKIEKVVLTIVAIASGELPLIRQATAGNVVAQAAEDKLQAAFNVIITAGQMVTAISGAGGHGSDKLKAATPFIAGLVQDMPQFTGKKPKDEAAFEAHCAALTSSLADIFNDYGD